ncbi:MAG: hypothetical protein WAX69_24540 [Victivallales bacterium]
MNLKLNAESDLLSQLKELLHNLNALGQDQVNFDISEAKWITPLSILPISYLASINQSSKLIHPDDYSISNYLSTISFPAGTKGLSATHAKSYLPIMTIRSNSMAEQIYEAIDQYERGILSYLVREQTFRDYIANSIRYFLGEFFTNYQEHSKASEFRIFSQLYPKRDALEICLLDNGIGIMNSFLRATTPIQVTDDMDALQRAVSGLSTKPGERGYGLRTSIKLICESELKGEIIILSGSACYYQKFGQQPQIYKLNTSWQGVIVAMTIHKPLSQIDIYKYVE